MRYQLSLVAMTTGLLGLSFIDGRYLVPQIMQHVPTVPLLLLLAWASYKSLLSHTAFTCSIVFLLLHILGARYTYSNLPYDEWAMSAFGRSISEQFGWTRNHYDRLVHFSFGVLVSVPIVELARPASNSKLLPVLFSFCFIGAGSAIYEAAEWALTLFMSPFNAETYNGQQGDMWDPQKDMLLAMVGSALVLVAMHTTLRQSKKELT